MKKRKNECLVCDRRSCYERVVSSDDGGKTYDEVACDNHIKELHKKAPKIYKHFISSTGKQSRGTPFYPTCQQFSSRVSTKV